MISGGWISQREASLTRYDPGPVEYAREEKEMIPQGWNWQREASNKHQDPGPVDGNFEEDMILGTCNG